MDDHHLSNIKKIEEKKKTSSGHLFVWRHGKGGGVGNPSCVTLTFPYTKKKKKKNDPILGTKIPQQEQTCPESTLQSHKMPPSACESSAKGGAVHANAKVKKLGQVSPSFSISFFVNSLCFSLSVCVIYKGIEWWCQIFMFELPLQKPSVC
jgi:hypothetical protein